MKLDPVITMKWSLTQSSPWNEAWLSHHREMKLDPVITVKWSLTQSSLWNEAWPSHHCEMKLDPVITVKWSLTQSSPWNGQSHHREMKLDPVVTVKWSLTQSSLCGNEAWHSHHYEMNASNAQTACRMHNSETFRRKKSSFCGVLTSLLVVLHGWTTFFL